MVNLNGLASFEFTNVYFLEHQSYGIVCRSISRSELFRKARLWTFSWKLLNRVVNFDCPISVDYQLFTFQRVAPLSNNFLLANILRLSM